MKYLGLYLRYLFAFFLLLTSLSSLALELIDTQFPPPLKQAYAERYNDPQGCITTTQKYIAQQNSLSFNTKKIMEKSRAENKNIPAIQLQAFCYAQTEDYVSALNLLQPLMKNPSVSADEITTLNIVASMFPEEERIHLSNLLLLQRLIDSEARIEKKPLKNHPNLKVAILFTISKLSLQIHRYRDAFNTLEKIKKEIKNSNNEHLNAWLTYYYGLYYNQINQQQLASSSFRIADQLADKHGFIQLGGEVKNSIAKLYQEKYRFSIALKFAQQRVELYLNTTNKIKQADSLIQFAVLKRQNNESNNALIYLFNALELIENNKHSDLLAHAYLEIGRTYIANNITLPQKNNELELAQKYLQNARFHFIQLHKPRYQVETLLLLAKLNIMNKEPALAILQLEKVLQLSANKYLSLRVQAFEMLALSYEMTGNLQQAIVNFKNFHALQNRIKEHLFKLQQLQISEQLQLFEKTQQQIQLETKNTQSQKVTAHYKILSYSAVSLLIVMTLLFFSMLKRNKTLCNVNKYAQQRLAIHPRTKLPFQHAGSNQFQYPYRETPLYYALLNIPFLYQINELLGTYGAMKIEKKLGKELKIQFSYNVDIVQIRGNQILFIGKQKNYKNAGEFAQQIEAFFTGFSNKNGLSDTVSCGIVAFPFLKNANRAFSPSRTLNLSSLALFAASQIRKEKHQSSWVELYAIDNLQPAFFNGDLWTLAQQAIAKGIVKINSSHAKYNFNWPKPDL